MNTTELAKLQDDVIHVILKNYTPVQRHLKKLKNNFWVKIAEKTAPNNLVVRNICILALGDIIDHRKAKRRIWKQLKELSGNYAWKEGYSYWLYTKPILQHFALVFNYQSIQEVIKRIDKDFQETAYIKNGLLYPAPFGDVRNEPLEESLQDFTYDLTKRIGCSWLVREMQNQTIYYHIRPASVSFNTHCPSKYENIRIGTKGILYTRTNNNDWTPFQFYNGYDKKYKNKWEQFKDTFLNPNRW